MSSIFLDSDVILDVFAERHPFYETAASILTLIEGKHITGCTSSLIFSNLYYVLRRLRNREIAISSLRKLNCLIDILAVDEQDIQFALHSTFTDFEDAVQYHTALQHHIAYLITRNIKDYKTADKSMITVCTPEQYLKLRNKSNGHLQKT